ncbi:hypothetical protein [Marinobacter sp. ANT_B65]|uniref:hypothetical protein n=1 Tax=Marinobacter sp. ANT_B65 TaxID=2039467 RepID=UPI000BBEDA37|nr:hypothetical protein [Marinobacter sp. ANT_B65]PCM46112.1 hypothetical protein CPA50_09260 [Marinobacter sp. ANT_B65]
MLYAHTRSLIAVSSFALLAGCASNAPQDTTPKNPTSVVHATFAFNGGFVPDVSGKQTVYTRSDMRRIDNINEFDNFLMRFANSDTSDIFRIDRNLLWLLDNDDESYRECPLAGCVVSPLFLTEESRGEEEEEYETYEDRECAVTLAQNEFSVEDTGNTRRFGGLDASEYVVSWQTKMEDEQGRADVNLLQFVFWTAPPTQEMSQAWRVHSEAMDNYLDAVGDDNILVRLLGRDGFKAIGSFVGDIEKTDETAYNSWASELGIIEGYPLSIKMEWFQRNEACPKVKEAKSTDIDLTKGLDGLKSAAGNLLDNMVNEKKEELIAEWQKKPKVRYIYEVNSIAEELVHDSVFNLPADYKLSDRQ